MADPDGHEFCVLTSLSSAGRQQPGHCLVCAEDQAGPVHSVALLCGLDVAAGDPDRTVGQVGQDGAVLSLAGDPIPGLFAAGRASSGMHGEGYISGTSLGDGTFFGRRAGRSAAS
ncbi:FAD-binding protein [Nocardioides speluncae]|uniref:FAD-binding protein n=1 Tax=Nocardioides speluncae TaxID=2670337 RepID=UPI00197F7E58|nr:FAD-binding protein [Nocardioides speluncae]